MRMRRTVPRMITAESQSSRTGTGIITTPLAAIDRVRIIRRVASRCSFLLVIFAVMAVIDPSDVDLELGLKPEDFRAGATVWLQVAKDGAVEHQESFPLSTVEPGLRDLIDHTVSHFSHEERLMRSMRYPAYAWHKGQHDTVRAKVADLQRRVQKGDREAVLPALDFLTAWLQTHTAVSDRMMGAFLRTQGFARGFGCSKSRPGDTVVDEPQP